MFPSPRSRQWRWVFRVSAGCLGAGLIGLSIMIIVIRAGLQRASDDALRRFGGNRVEALIASVRCETCSLRDRNLSVWALGQMVAVPALPALKTYYTGQPCDHAHALCQYELRKAIRMIETRDTRKGLFWNAIAALHRPRD